MNRLLLPRITILLVFIALVARLYQLQLVDNQTSQYRYGTGVSTTRFLPIRPIRGEIYAADGSTVLAASLPIYSASIRPADLPRDTHERLAVFTELGELLGISTTLTISPSTVLETDALLRSDLIQGLGQAQVNAARFYSNIDPISFTTLPDQAAAAQAFVDQYPQYARVAFEPVPQAEQDEEDERESTPTPEPSPDPDDGEHLGPSEPEPKPVEPITGTLTIDPATAVIDNQALRGDLARLLRISQADLPSSFEARTWASIEVPPTLSDIGFMISEAYSTSVKLENPIANQVMRADIPGYETIIVQRDIPHEVALVLIENSASLPGVVVEQDYRRSYPLSEQVKSLSHILGYMGRVNECDLVRSNPVRSWMMSLLDSVGHAAQCGFVQKQVNPSSLGIARYLNDDRIGKDGLEGSYENELRGQLGRQSILVDAMNQPVRAPETVQPAYNGNNLVLTIDLEFQREVEQILQNWIDVGEQRRLQQSGAFAYKREYKPIKSGVAIVTEINTGRILAMASLPSYDNNLWDPSRSQDWSNFFNPTDPEERAELIRLAPLVNHAIAGQYPPGSTLKPIDYVLALDAGIVTPDTTVRDPGALVLEDQFVEGRFYNFPNSVPRDNGYINGAEALMRSSNVFFMSIMGGNSEQVVNLRPEEQTIKGGLGITRFAEGLSEFGFNQTTGIRLSGELRGRVPTPKWAQETLLQTWTTGDTYNASIGQGHLEATPIQLLMASAAIANNGALYVPQLVKQITNSSGEVIREIEPELIRQLDIAPEHFAAARQGLRMSVTQGVNVAARDDCSGLSIAGKTGTAEYGPIIQIPTATGGIREVRQSHSWFVGFAPYDNPEIEVLVLVEGTGDLGDGSATIAVPAVTQIMQAYYNIMPPNPLPLGCQTDMPPLPNFNAPAPSDQAVPPEEIALPTPEPSPVR